MDVTQAKSFHILDETETDVSIGFLMEDGQHKIVIIPKEKLTYLLQELKEVFNTL